MTNVIKDCSEELITEDDQNGSDDGGFWVDKLANNKPYKLELQRMNNFKMAGRYTVI